MSAWIIKLKTSLSTMPTFNRYTTIQEIATAYPGALEGRTYLITGGTNGLGFHFAKFIAQQGVGTVVITGRSEEKLSKALEEVKAAARANTTVIPLFLDLESQTLCVMLRRKSLLENSGFPKSMFCSTMPVLWRYYTGRSMVMKVNSIGHFLFTNLILSHIKSPGGRIVCVSSYGHRNSPVRFDDINFGDGEVYNKWKGYAQSKTANILFSIGLNKRLSETKGIEIYSIHPGPTGGTGLANHLDLVAEGLKDEKGNWNFDARTLDEGVATHLYAALSPELKGKGGTYLTECQIRETVTPMTDEDVERLWELSNSILGTKF
ncbi:hypothetical protein BDQ17DRAFT_1541496 [Cyathus striatus]|nr:hypothetical protein BDQ17DRAFT_1541496 [Cyathus striatus]